MRSGAFRSFRASFHLSGLRFPAITKPLVGHSSTGALYLLWLLARLLTATSVRPVLSQHAAVLLSRPRERHGRKTFSTTLLRRR